MVASTLLVLTTGRQYCERYVDKLPVQDPAMPDPVSAPDVLPALARAHARVQRRPWLRERVKAVAASLRKE